MTFKYLSSLDSFEKKNINIHYKMIKKIATVKLVSHLNNT